MITRFAITVALFFCISIYSHGQDNFEITTAIKLEFDTIPGRAYAIEASLDLKTWQTVAVVHADSLRTKYFAEITKERQFYRAAIAPVASNWIHGTWTGSIFQAFSSTNTFSGTMRMDTVNNTYRLSLATSTSCTGNLLFLSQDSTTAVFDLKITSGSCVDGKVTFRRLTPDLMSYQWEHKDGANVAVSFGLLTKQ